MFWIRKFFKLIDPKNKYIDKSNVKLIIQKKDVLMRDDLQLEILNT